VAAVYWQSPKGAFTAIEPPAWLQHDLQIAEARTPLRRMHSLILFADQLPHHQQANAYDMTEPVRQARLEKLAGYVEKVFGTPFHKSNFRATSALVSSGAADTNAIREFGESTHVESGYVDTPLITAGRATRGLVILSPQSRKLRNYLAQDYGVTEAQLGEDITNQALARKELWHELGHLWRALCVPGVMAGRREERLCDVFAQRGCKRAGDPLAASLIAPLRALDALAGPVVHGAIAYWNALTMAVPSTTLSREMTAQLDLKARALGVHDATKLSLWALVSGPEGKFLREAYQMPRPFEARLRTLHELDRTQPYVNDDSRQLGQLTLSAAARVLPGVIPP
jgi:hypothetical protein